MPPYLFEKQCINSRMLIQLNTNCSNISCIGHVELF